jgi:hypothetical protein
MLRKALCVLVCALMAAPSVIAQVSSKATTFSFASDDHDDGPTFTSVNVNQITSAKQTVFDLIVDMNDDAAGGLVTFQALHEFDVFLYDYQVAPCGPGWLHAWKAKGVASFNHFNVNTGFPMILFINIPEGLFTSYSPFPDRLGETATLQDSNSADGLVSFIAGAQLIGIGVPQAAIDASEDFAYTFTHIRTTANLTALPKLNSKGEFLEDWQSEGSFSAAAEP